MKTISKRFLKGGLAVLLAVVMLFGTTLTGFAAVVDNAETGANVDVAVTSVDHTGGYVYFLKPSTWTSTYVMMFIGHDSYTSVYQMTKVTNTDNLYRYSMGSWGGATYIAFANASSLWGSGNWGPSNRTNATHYTNVYNNYQLKSGNYYVWKPASTSNNAGITPYNPGTTASTINLTTRADVYGAASGSTTYSSNAAEGTVSVSGYYMSAYSTASARAAVSSTATTAYASTTLAPASTATFTAAANPGYEFVGWSTSSSEANIVSTDATYKFAYDISYTAKTVYALFKQAQTYTATFVDWDGTTISTQSGLASGATPTAPTDPTRAGYTFTGWDPEISEITADTTYTAQYSINTYTATFKDYDGTTLETQEVEYGSTPTAPANPARAGYTFTGWSPTVSAITGDTTYTAQYSINKYTLTVTEQGGDGTVTLNSDNAGPDVNMITVDYGKTVTISVTPPAGYKIASIAGGGLSVGEQADGASWSDSVVVSADIDITVTYAVSGSCSPVFANGVADPKLVLGATYTNTASGNNYCNGSKVCTYISSDPSIASVDITSGLVTALKPGTATITATCNCGSTASYPVTVKEPKVTVPAMTLDVNATGTAQPTITDAPVKYDITYKDNSEYFNVTENGIVTAVKPGTGTVSYSLEFNGSVVATGSFNVTVSTPAYTINPLSENLIVGQTMTDAFVTTTSVEAESITFSSDNSAIASISGGKATGEGEGTAIITASFKYNESYTATATAKVIVAAPIIEADPESVALEFGEGSTATTTTVTISTNADSGNGTGDDVTVETANANVATATYADGKVTVTATGVGSTTITAKFHDATVEIPVTVSAYNPYFTIYLTNNKNYATPNLWYWNDGGSGKGVNMVYIGENSDGQNIFAYRFDKDSIPDNIIFRDGEWAAQTNDIDLESLRTTDSNITSDSAAFYLDGSNSPYSAKTWNMILELPTVSVDDVAVSIGGEAEVTATTANAGNLYWTTASTSIAKVTDTTSATTKVTGVASGETTLTARAFIATTQSSIKTLPSNYKTDSTSWPYISTAATAKVTVASVDHTITAYAAFSTNGTDYETGTTGGDVAIVVDDETLGATASVAHGKEYTLTATANDGYSFVGWYDENNNLITEPTIQATSNATYTAKFIKLYNVTFQDSTTEHAVGSTVTLTATAPEGQYLSNVAYESTATIDDLKVNDDNVITFTMPDADVTLTPTFTEYAHVNFTDTTGLTLTGYKTGYMAGENIEITVKPETAQVTISDLTVDNDALTATKNDDGTWTIIGTLTAGQTVTVTPTVDAKFSASVKQVAIGNFGTGVTVFGSVDMEANGATITSGSYVDPGTEVTYTAKPSTNYTFVGFYSDEACKQPIQVGVDTTSVTVNADTTVYALFARRQWMTYHSDYTTGDYVKELVYDPSIGAYTHTTTLTSGNSSTTAINTGAWFRVTNNKDRWGTTSGECYHSYTASKFTVNFNGNGYGATIGWAVNDGSSNAWKLTTSAEGGSTITFILTPDGNTAIDISAKTSKEGSMIYLSSGRLDLPGNYSATTDFTGDITEGASKTLKNNEKNTEEYSVTNIPTAQMVTFQTTLSGDDAANYYVDSYVIYDILDKTFTIVEPNTLGNNTYSGSAYVDSDCYIIPIYFHTDEYLKANNMAAIDIYFDATAVQSTDWGPFVAAYSWGSEGAEYAGVWSGQMMIPTEDGTSFYTQIEVPAYDAENRPSVPQGVALNNYIYATCPADNAATFGVTTTCYQTYDYREPITLYEDGFDVMTFVAKYSEDGEHSAVTSATNPLDSKFVYEYLVCRDGVTPMDFSGNAIENAPELGTSNADYYVISQGEKVYDPNGYIGDPNYDADHAVDWYVFDSTGKFLAKVLSTAMYHDNNGDGKTVLEEALGVEAGALKGKTVAITYEALRNNRYDGQWYGNYVDDDVQANVLVGLVDDEGNFNIDTEDPTNDADYGEGWLVAQEEREGYTVGDKYAELPISLDLGVADLSATTKDGYRFVGWYTQKADGTYVQISSAANYNTYINLNTTYYAMFKEIGKGEVVVNHLKYDNQTDPYIPSHNGVATMTVEVKDSTGTVLSSGTPSTDISTATFPATEGQSYTITITTTPLMNGEFFAWYTDSETVDGTKTYEEIGTTDDVVNSTSKVTFTFEFEYDGSMNVINLYSDVTRVSNKADFFYKYLNRFGEWRTYTVRDIELTDDECRGYAGNGNNEYVPTYITEWTYDDGSKSYGENPLDKTVVSSYNAVQMYAPSDKVTQVYDGIVKWTVNDTFLTTSKSLVTLTADQGLPQYTITYTMPDVDLVVKTFTATGLYNQLLDIKAPATNKEGKSFSYWVDENDKILTYTLTYNFRIVENKKISAVYGAVDTPDWIPTIESVTYTREFSDSGDYIYTDYHLAYTSKDRKVLNDIKDDEGIEYGLLVLRNADYYIDDSSNVTYPVVNDTIKGYLESIAKDKKKNTAFNVDGYKYNCYYYDLTGKELTNFNRIDYYLKYNNNAVVGDSHYYKEYAFTAVAYIIVGGQVYLSNPENVNFYELANEAVFNAN